MFTEALYIPSILQYVERDRNIANEKKKNAISVVYIVRLKKK